LKKTVFSILAAAILLTSCAPKFTLEEVAELTRAGLPAIEAAYVDVDVEVLVEETALVYQYAFKNKAEDRAEAASAIGAGVAAQWPEVEATLKQLKSAGFRDAAVIIRYIDSDGSVIYETKFSQ
jgi:hypothetical protein